MAVVELQLCTNTIWWNRQKTSSQGYRFNDSY